VSGREPADRDGGAARAAAALPEAEDLFSVSLEWRRWWAILPEIVALACTGALPLLVGANVLSRYTNLYRIFWAEDVVKLLFLWVVFLGGALAVKHDAHVRMRLLSDRMLGGRRAAAVWAHIVQLSPLVVGSTLLVLGIRIVEISMRRELPSLQIPVGYFTTVIPASGALMIFYTLRGYARRDRWAKLAGSAGP
jgi:TRAP-type C4-dicarboxylate transport system permease small subunit